MGRPAHLDDLARSVPATRRPCKVHSSRSAPPLRPYTLPGYWILSDPARPAVELDSGLTPPPQCGRIGLPARPTPQEGSHAGPESDLPIRAPTRADLWQFRKGGKRGR